MEFCYIMYMMVSVRRMLSQRSKEEAADVDFYRDQGETMASHNQKAAIAELPLYEFCPGSPPQKDLLNFLFQQWETRRERGLFHHDITACERKVTPGEHGFIIQLIQGRDLKKRPTEFPLDKVLQPSDGTKFNFTKIAQDEMLMLLRFQESEGSVPCDSPDIVAINVSPIAYGHVLLIPRILDLLPQRIDPKSFFLALCMAKEAGSPFFRVGYNSLGAFATINHLHFQACYCELRFPVEKAPTERIATLRDGVEILRLVSYPVRGLAFEGGSRLQDLSNAISRVCIWLQDNNIAYNVLISDSGRRILLFPQGYAEKRARGEVSQDILETQVSPAVWEISGYLVLKRRKDYEEASEECVKRLLELVSLSEERFQKVQGSLLKALCSNDG